MFNHTKCFLNQTRAMQFVQELAAQGRQAEIWRANDAFGQTEYTVKWN